MSTMPEGKKSNPKSENISGLKPVNPSNNSDQPKENTASQTDKPADPSQESSSNSYQTNQENQPQAPNQSDSKKENLPEKENTQQESAPAVGADKPEAESKTPPAPSQNSQDEKVTPLKENKPKSSKKKLFFLLLFIILIIGSALALFMTGIISLEPKFISPIPESTNVLSYETREELKKKEVIGFLPYWNFKQEPNIRYQLLTQIAFFALGIDADGNIIKFTEDGNQEPGWTAYNSQTFGEIIRKARNSGTRVILTLQCMNHDAISSVVNDPKKRRHLVDQTLDIIELKNLDGINIDFEYAGSPPNITVNNFTLLLSELRQALDEKNTDLILNVDVFADSTNKVRLWDIPEITNYVDQIIIMAYDFHRASSTIAAPVAPIRGAPEHWPYDITKTLANFTKIIPPGKIILGVPYYGYEWQTTSQEPYATTYPNTGALASFNRIQNLIETESPQLYWDEIALAPRITRLEKGKIYQIYYENETSLGIKYDLIHQSGLGGTAIWALGYDGERHNFWNLLAEKFFVNKTINN